jgi:hypothetical protein
MKNVISTLLILQALTSNAQIPKDVEILEIKFLDRPTDSLVCDLDKSNSNSLKRLPILDSAAKHHAEYLIIHYINTDSLTHREYVNYPNFVEKAKSEDRTGFKNQTSEICSVITKTAISNPRLVKKSYLDILRLRFSYKETLEGYRNSPAHWSIATDKRSKFVGSCTVMVLYKTTRGLTKDQIDKGFINIVYNNFNVTVFIEDPKK